MRDRCGKRPMLAPKTNSESRNLNFSQQKSQQTARFELNKLNKYNLPTKQTQFKHADSNIVERSSIGWNS